MGTKLAAVVAVAVAITMQAAAPKPPTPTDGIAGIADALRSYRIVGLSAGEGHGDERGPAFLASLIRDPRISAAPTDIVMEGLNARYQPSMDRYTNGESVSDAELRPIWDDTTQQQLPGPIWTGEPTASVRVVHEVNAALPRDRRFRVLLGDPPIEWERVHTRDDFQRWLAQRDSFAADLIQREVIAKGRRALLSFGGGHLQRKNQMSNYDMDDPIEQTVISLLERAGTKTFVVRDGSGRDGFNGWPVPSLAILRGTTLGAADEPAGSPTRFAVKDGKLSPLPKDKWKTMRLEDQTDALVYLGPESTRTELPFPRAICSDPARLELRFQRMALAGLPQSVIDRVKQECGK